MYFRQFLLVFFFFTALALSSSAETSDLKHLSDNSTSDLAAERTAVFSSFFSLQSNPLYVTRSERYHIVKKGDTLFSISRKYSISVNNLKLYNNLESDHIFVGQKIYLTPTVTAKSEYVTVREIPDVGYHLVKRGETVYRISKMYNLEIMDILEFNNLASFDIQAGQKIWLVAGKTDPAIVAPATEEEAAADESPEISEADYEYHIVKSGENLYRISLLYDMTLPKIRELNSLTTDDINVGQRLKVIRGQKAPERERVAVTPSRRPVVTTPGVHKKGSVHLPLRGTVLSEFGIRNNMPHNGIDISAPVGEPINAALGGKVVFVGVQRGYGNVVVLEHDNYIMTVYAHNERNLVRLGDSVKEGQPIATVGQSGNATAPHLHFEYRVRGKAIDPRKVLPVF